MEQDNLIDIVYLDEKDDDGFNIENYDLVKLEIFQNGENSGDGEEIEVLHYHNTQIEPTMADIIKTIWGEHIHCMTCFNSNCSNSICSVVKCDHCKIRLHQCKLKEHLEEICPMTFGPCINAAYGCYQSVRRDRRGIHLKKCPASVLVCNLQWSRQIICKSVKRRMKHVARKHKNFIVEKDDIKIQEIEPNELDVWAAICDQDEIMKSYRSTRKCRVSQRTSVTPVNPVLPLRFHQLPEQQPTSDSSDAEQFEEERKRKKTKQPFADCYICRRDPGMQHLHVLGNLNQDYAGNGGSAQPELDIDSQLALIVPKFHQKRNLFVSLSEDRMVDSYRKAFQHLWVREMHTFTCYEMFHRTEFEAHWKYHNNILQDLNDRIIRRCPGAMNGCDFFVQAMQPITGGRIRFDKTIKLFTTEPMPNLTYFTAKESFIGAIVNPHCLRLLAPYLDTTSLRSLAATNSFINAIVRDCIEFRKMASLKWKRVASDTWIVDKIIYSFSNIPVAPSMIPSTVALCELRQHTDTCLFLERIDHGRDVSLFNYTPLENLETPKYVTNPRIE